ncbi:hypothetical protein SteCoe_12578 [Stentor coeruleus]|uniref:Uncharacterized protein n=1 Tax=Stentor coeruleus TaxID=5963 RepID=A0A1R2CAI0_9CILI|nr:hypothetical protein SteCoe_12578 [Stentor coeruleus]
MTERLPGKYKSDLHSKPWFFGGKVPDIKYSYTIAGLTPSQYPIRPRSINPGAKVNIHPIKPSFINVDEMRSQEFKRDFREYNFLKDDDVLLTIEHCDNCEEHASSTRHDPAKYYQYAQSIKNSVLTRYPMVKILIKPVSKLDPESNKKRMGAFEVQVSCKTKGKLTVTVLHSKLDSRKWPDVNDVVSKLSTYLPTCQLFVTVFDQNNQEKTLKGLKVLVRPKPLDFEMQKNTNEAEDGHFTRNFSGRPGTAFRPKSAATNRSVKSMRVMSGRRFSHKNLSKVKNPIVYEKITDRDGTCLFDNFPLDVYEIEVVETKEFKGAVKVFNTFEEKLQNSSLNVYIGVKSRDNASITVIIKDPLLKEEVSNAKVTIIKDAEIYYLAEIRRGVYEISVPKGDYSLSIVSGKYKDVDRKIQANDPEIIITENLELKKTKEINVYTYDAMTGESLSGVIIELVINNHTKFEGFTKSGKHGFKLEETGQYSIKSKIRNYCKSKISLIVGNSDINCIFIPLVPLNIDYSVIVISWCKCSDDLEVHGQTNTKALNFQNPEIEGFKMFDLMKSHGFTTICILDDNEDLRVTIRGLTKELISFNGMLYTGLNVQFYSMRNIISCIKPSSGGGEWWDVGFYSGKRKDFIETNIVASYRLPMYEFIQDFISVIRHIQACDAVADAFNFLHGVTKTMSYGKDLFLSPEIFKKNMQNIVSAEFLNIYLMTLTSTDGVSLIVLTNRYERYVGIGKSPYRKLEHFIADLGVDKDDEKDFRGLIEETWLAKFPENWEAIKDLNGDIVYQNLEGEISKEYPNIVICRKKIMDIKREELKVKNKHPEPVKKIDEKPKINEKSGQSRPSSSSKNSSKSKNYSEKSRSSSSSSSHSNIDEYNENFYRNANEQCEKLAELALQNIEFYHNNKKLDKDIHKQLSQKIKEYLENFDEQLKDNSDDQAIEFFNFWKAKYLEIRGALEEIQNQVRDEVQNKKRGSKRPLSSSTNKSKDSSVAD